MLASGACCPLRENRENLHSVQKKKYGPLFFALKSYTFAFFLLDEMSNLIICGKEDEIFSYPLKYLKYSVLIFRMFKIFRCTLENLIFNRDICIFDPRVEECIWLNNNYRNLIIRNNL